MGYRFSKVSKFSMASKLFCVGVIFMAAIWLGAPLASAAAGNLVCDSAKQEFAELISAQPKNCTNDNDCQGYYYDTDSCAPAYILAKSHENDLFTADLIKIQDKIRTNCTEGGPACSPIPFRAACKQGVCVDLLQKPRQN